MVCGLDSRPFAGYWGFYDLLEDLGNALLALWPSTKARAFHSNLFSFPSVHAKKVFPFQSLLHKHHKYIP
jgi:hypothetical protein